MRFARLHRRRFAILMFGIVLFAALSGIARACASPATPGHATYDAVHAAPSHGALPSGCAHGCSDVPPMLVGVRDEAQPSAAPAPVARNAEAPRSPTSVAPVVILPAHPPPDVSLLLRSLRFAL